MLGRLINLTICPNRKQRITVEVGQDFRDKFDQLKNADLDIEIKKHRERRSRSANAYFHVLVNKIAAEKGGSEEKIKALMVCEYGALMLDADGVEVGLNLPASVDVSTVYPYTRYLESYEANGKLYHVYLMYKQTHLMDSKEMSRLIDGTIETAQELGIETETPEQLARYKEVWNKS